MTYLSIPSERASLLKELNGMDRMSTAEGEVALAHEEYIFEKKIPSLVKESHEKFRKYKGDLSRLGEINWNADNDFERQKIRYEFLRTQEQELRKSMDDLLGAIKMIDEKSLTRFKLAYEEINERFTKVFPIIFGGGNACLQLTGAIDDPECGVEIVAQPPGKKMQNINLMSGGEKALTAVSLIFSIFLVKPSPFCLLDEVDAPLDDANVGRFNELLREMSQESQFVLITHNKKTMELNDTLYGITMQEPGVSKALSVQLQ
jgi:chromosome segregation protein